MKVRDGDNGFTVGGGIDSTLTKAVAAGAFTHSGYGTIENGAVLAWRARRGDHLNLRFVI